MERYRFTCVRYCLESGSCSVPLVIINNNNFNIYRYGETTFDHDDATHDIYKHDKSKIMLSP